MATDTWTDGTANWDTPRDWSAGLPGPSSDVVINTGDPRVTASFGTVASITNSAILDFIDAGASSVTGNVTVGSGTGEGSLLLDIGGKEGGSTLTIGGKLNNYNGLLQIGGVDNTLSAPSTIEAGKLANGGSFIDLFGSSTAQATLDVGSAAGFGTARALTGGVDLSGDAVIEFASGQITTIAANGELFLVGPRAFVADASDTSSNSALEGLRTVTGYLELGNGATVTTSGGLTNTNYINLDTRGGSPGGSLLNINGALTNSGTIQLGPSYLSQRLSVESKLNAASVLNTGTIDLHGDQAAGVEATLHSRGTFTNDGSINLSNDILTNDDKLAGPVSGTGNFSLSGRSTLNFASSVSSGEKVTFQGVDKLILGQPSSFDGTIDGFSTKGDIVVVKGFGEATTLLYAPTGADSCSLTLSDTTHTAVLNFTGAPYTKSDFALLPWYGGAGSAIKFV
jgi:hypothetical protein